MTDVRLAYNQWAESYDSSLNKTRDLEGQALRQLLPSHHFETVLEVGCGTGKNTAWLAAKATRVLAVDLSEEMLAKAKEKNKEDNIIFLQADITREWPAGARDLDLVSFSLMLEHIQDLAPVISKAAYNLREGGHLYLGELHPFRQYGGSKARFETVEGVRVVDCFNHHVSDFTGAATEAGLRLVRLEEFFDDNERSGVPRILAMLFAKG